MSRNALLYVAILFLFGGGIFAILNVGAKLPPAAAQPAAVHAEVAPAAHTPTGGIAQAFVENVKSPLSILLLQVIVIVAAARAPRRPLPEDRPAAGHRRDDRRHPPRPLPAGVGGSGRAVVPLPGGLDGRAEDAQPDRRHPLHVRGGHRARRASTCAPRRTPRCWSATRASSCRSSWARGSALLLYRSLAPAGIPFSAFALFIGVAMSITAFPVLARILEDRRMSRSLLGSTAIACAAVDDVTAWCLLAVVVAIVKSDRPGRLPADHRPHPAVHRRHALRGPAPGGPHQRRAPRGRRDGERGAPRDALRLRLRLGLLHGDDRHPRPVRRLPGRRLHAAGLRPAPVPPRAAGDLQLGPPAAPLLRLHGPAHPGRPARRRARAGWSAWGSSRWRSPASSAAAWWRRAGRA